jgi:hypothetical protein
MKALGLYRTTKVNYVPYTNDGNGRDNYISNDRGGLFSNHNSKNQENIRKTGTSLNTKISYKSVSPYVKTPTFHYHSDGYGRDSYIYTNGGGLLYDSKPLNAYKLTDFLRSEDDNCASNEKTWLSKNQSKYQKYLRAKEKDIIHRLYTSEKKKYTKNSKRDNNQPIQTETDITLPKLFDKKNNSENEKKEDNKNEEFFDENENEGEHLNLNKKLKNKTNDNLYTDFLKSLSKINRFDVNKRLKINTKSLNQPFYI